MLWPFLIILLVIWLVGVVSSYTMGGLIHVFLVGALIVLIYQLVTRRSVTKHI